MRWFGSGCQGLEGLVIFVQFTQRVMTTFKSALQSLPQFVLEMDADWCMVYDWMEDQCGPLKDYHWEEVSQVFKETLEDSRY